MNKIFAAFIALGLVACSAAPSPEPTQEEKSSEQTTEVSDELAREVEGTPLPAAHGNHPGWDHCGGMVKLTDIQKHGSCQNACQTMYGCPIGRRETVYWICLCYKPTE
jgi:hypothetical protein